MTRGLVIIDNLHSASEVQAIINRHHRFVPKYEPFWINDLRIHSIRDYNSILTNFEFWEMLPFDKVLICQHDSGLLREGIEEFEQYDYIGAPWKFQEHGGNGGLSLRSRHIMMDIIQHFPFTPAMYGNEDVYFSNNIQKVGGNLAPREACSRFSCETIFQLGTLGYHAIDKYLTAAEVQKIYTQYEK